MRLGEAVRRHSVRDDGDGPLMVLVHGMEANWQSWSRFAERLGGRWRIDAVEMPWRTGSEYTWGRQGSAGTWLGAALSGLGEAPAVVVGHSLGANAVLEALSADGAVAVRAAVLLAPSYRPADCTLSWEFFEDAKHAFRAQIGDGLRTWLGRRRPVDEQLLDTMLAKLLERVGPVAFTEWFSHFAASTDIPAEKLAAPVLVLGGWTDPVVANGRAEALAARLPAATLALAGHYDHFCHIKQASEVAREVTRFLAASRVTLDTEGSVA